MAGHRLMDLMLKPGYIDPELQQILRDLKTKPPVLTADLDIIGLRKQLSDAKKNLTAANTVLGGPTIVERDVSITARDGSSIKLRIHSPPQQKRAHPTPAWVVLHGGGWCLGDLDNETLLARKFCSEIGGICINVDYRLAPEHKYPTAVYDCYDALLWTVKHAAEIGVELRAGFIVGGPSAGANLAAVISQMWRDDKCSPPLTGIYLSVPATCASEVVPQHLKARYRSRDENASTLVLTRGAMELFQKLYAPDPASHLFSPLLDPRKLAGLPRTYIQVCGMDPLRDEGLLYEKALRDAGVETNLSLYPGLPHSFWTFFPEAKFSKKQVEDSVEGLRWLLKAGRAESKL